MTTTTYLELDDQATGANNNTWGDVADANMLYLELAIARTVSIATTGGTTTLTAAQNRYPCIRITGILVSNAVIEVKAQEGHFIFINATTGAYTVEVIAVGGTGKMISRTFPMQVYCDGTNVESAGPLDNAEFTTLEIGHASDTTLSRSAAGLLAVEGVVVPTISSTNTLTNKRVSPRVSVAATTTSPWGWNSDSYDQLCLTALNAAITISADAGTPTHGQRCVLRIEDDGTARALTWTTGASKAFRVIGVTLPTTTVLGKTLYIGMIYNDTDSRWDVLAVAQEE